MTTKQVLFTILFLSVLLTACAPIQEPVVETEPVIIEPPAQPTLNNLTKTVLLVPLIQTDLTLFERSSISILDILQSDELELVDDWDISHVTLTSGEKWLSEQGESIGKAISVTYDISEPIYFDNRDLPTTPNPSQFSQTLLDNSLNISEYDGYLIFLLHDGVNQYRSFEQNGFIFMHAPNAHTTFDAISIVRTIVHESLHLWGAVDLYGSRGFACDMEVGVPEPEKEFNQSKACIMCGSRVIGPKGVEAISSFEDVVICNQTFIDLGLFN